MRVKHNMLQALPFSWHCHGTAVKGLQLQPKRLAITMLSISTSQIAADANSVHGQDLVRAETSSQIG